MRTELPTPDHIGFFEGAGARRARLISRVRDTLCLACMLGIAIAAVSLGWPS